MSQAQSLRHTLLVPPTSVQVKPEGHSSWVSQKVSTGGMSVALGAPEALCRAGWTGGGLGLGLEV